MEQAEEERLARRVMAALGLVFALLVVVTLLAIWLGQANGIASQIGVGLAILLASFTVGALFGFLFSVPRVLARGAATEDPAGASGSSAGPGRRLLETNSNLERISDWLSTLLLGAGLTQVSRAGEGLEAFGRFVARTAKGTGAAAAVLPVMAPMILLIGAALGFLAMYLYTRIEITRMLWLTERQLDPLDRGAQRAVAAQGIAAAGTVTIANIAPAVNITPGSIGVDDALDVMFKLLYQPDGYKRVLALAGTLSTTPATGRPDYWFYQAAALGQQHAALIAANDGEAASVAREQALKAAQRAVDLDPAYRDRLWTISTPGGPDDDLKTLRDDPAFKAIVGR